MIRASPDTDRRVAIRVTRDATVVIQSTETRRYAAGYEGAAPKALADQLVAAGAAERIPGQPCAPALLRREKRRAAT